MPSERNNTTPMELATLQHCRLCPRSCKVDRLHGETGFCGAGACATVALASRHYWEEPCISGTKGSGTVFFSRCNLRCAFCQNNQISWEGTGKDLSFEELAQVFIRQQASGVHNINLVSPTPYIPLIAAALRQAKKKGLAIPVVYNSNAFESIGGLRLLEGLVDIFLPDLKYVQDDQALRYSGVRGYFQAATSAVLEMHHQVGTLTLNKQGLAQRGLIIRHLVLPGQVGAARQILQWIQANLPLETWVSIMGQFVPLWQSSRYPEINRRLYPSEYNAVLDFFETTSLKNGYCQDLSSAIEDYVPMFDLSGLE
ncbi:MAG: Radical SAM superfamily protein [Pelotomaculum sp. PtaB.Bin104]|nr:MAG: Radical SAM superfamily protein [Pelotomaculum sp. PtaB.Bin104]